MERLTKRTYTISEPHVEMVTAVTGVNVTNILDRLASYEDAEEHGLLVRVVRCKDCLHRDPEDNKCDCGGLEHAHIHPVADDWFCADGEAALAKEATNDG